MVATINQNFGIQFSDMFHILVQQEASVLRNVFPVEIRPGEKEFFNRIGKFTASEVTQRLQPTNWQDAPHSRRMATVRQYEACTTLSSIDEIKMLLDPTNAYTKGLASAQGRNYDSVILSALLGTAATGADGTGTQAFDTTNQQVAHGSTTLTWAKIDSAIEKLEQNDINVDREPLVLILNARGKQDLYTDTTNRGVSVDFQKMKPLAGDPLMYRGIEFITTQLVPDETADTTFRAILCTKDSLRVAMAQDIRLEMAKLPEHSFALGIATYMAFGAVRMEETKVVDILFQ